MTTTEIAGLIERRRFMNLYGFDGMGSSVLVDLVWIARDDFQFGQNVTRKLRYLKARQALSSSQKGESNG